MQEEFSDDPDDNVDDERTRSKSESEDEEKDGQAMPSDEEFVVKDGTVEAGGGDDEEEETMEERDARIRQEAKDELLKELQAAGGASAAVSVSVTHTVLLISVWHSHTVLLTLYASHTVLLTLYASHTVLLTFS
jgi:hypothetical protein